MDTQNILPFGTPEKVCQEVKKRHLDFAPGSGYVFNPGHNIQDNVPSANILAMFVAAAKYGSCPIDIDS
ncbi:uroporphyrinogen decarboxylase [Candidatus Hakubella thermalkaliphila]|uniref:Uroporphyrinogen decarboxylase n=1 Tax=Candidatus Hakubella thermalkaliphila TaxID=2754717 RepID=A0A6V8P9N7_9ACTN|nr:uroporphyrinogen decarboxylase [Candidatus Hakubella thermalkaliphila]